MQKKILTALTSALVLALAVAACAQLPTPTPIPMPTAAPTATGIQPSAPLPVWMATPTPVPTPTGSTVSTVVKVSLVAPSNVLSGEVVTLQFDVQNVGDTPLVLWVHTWGAELQVLSEDGTEVWISTVGGHPLEPSRVVLQPGEVKGYERDWDQHVPPGSYLMRGIFRYSASKGTKLDDGDEIATEPKKLVIAHAPTPTARPPKGPGAEIGKPYQFRLGVHCGITQAKFDGRWWIADPIVGMNPPEDWDRYDEFGTMTLVTEDLAVFTTRSGRHSYEFIPWHSGSMPFGCY